jgi:hypothetical protein
MGHRGWLAGRRAASSPEFKVSEPRCCFTLLDASTLDRAANQQRGIFLRPQEEWSEAGYVAWQHLRKEIR